MTLNSEFSTGTTPPEGNPVAPAATPVKTGGPSRLLSFKQEIYNPLDTPQPDFSVPTSGAGAAAGAGITGAAGGGVQ